MRAKCVEFFALEFFTGKFMPKPSAAGVDSWKMCEQDVDFYKIYILREKMTPHAKNFKKLFLKIHIYGLEGACSHFLRSRGGIPQFSREGDFLLPPHKPPLAYFREKNRLDNGLCIMNA